MRRNLFGGSRPWNAQDWTDSDDRVRGGKSQSYLLCNASDPIARFHGTLDISALGGAGFASQRTTGDDRSWDLSAYAGIQLEVAFADSKRYTFLLKDEILPKRSDGREQSTISYEFDFECPQPGADGAASNTTTISIPWSAFKATYRGKDKPDAPPVNIKQIKRFSLMMRSFFAQQHGPFSLSLLSISAFESQTFDDANAQGAGAALQIAQPHTPRASIPKTDADKSNNTTTDNDTTPTEPYRDDPSSKSRLSRSMAEEGRDLEGYGGRYTDDEKAGRLGHSGDDVNVHYTRPRDSQSFLAWLSEVCTKCVRIR